MSIDFLLQQAAAGAAGEAVYVDDVFSTYLYTGIQPTDNTIDNGIDLDGEGGLVWIKRRSESGQHELFDTERGTTKTLRSNLTDEEKTRLESLKSFNSNGFTVGNDLVVNKSGTDFASWTFRKQPGFFDVVTYTGTGSATTVSHNLGSVPGCIIIKETSNTDNWVVYHRSVANTQALFLNATVAATTADTWNSTDPTATEFSLGTYASVNENGATYVAYLFAHDEQDFGTDSDESIIKCGSYTGNSSSNGPEIDLGFEPQWLMIKKAGSGTAGNWLIYDSMRGLVSGGNDYHLLANTSAAESNDDRVDLTPTGFKITSTTYEINSSGADYVYVAIRRPHKPAEEFAATDLFTTVVGSGNPAPNHISGFPVDAYFFRQQGQVRTTEFASRLQGNKRLFTDTTAAESTNLDVAFDFSNGVHQGGYSSTHTAWMFRRAPGFFDVVAYTGTGSATTIDHNLNVTPEMMIIKKRDSIRDWPVYHSSMGGGGYAMLNQTTAYPTNGVAWNSTDATASVFSVGSNTITNGSGSTYIAYLFATVPGISKVGSYTGTGSDVDVDCGFTSGARFVLVKRTDSTGDWYYWDTVRGIVAGNDPYLLFNSTAAQVYGVDYIDPLSSGFTITSGAPAALNASGGTYIFLAIA